MQQPKATRGSRQHLSAKFLDYQSHNLLLTSPTGQELPVGQGLVSHLHGVAVTLRGQCPKSLLIKKGILLPNMLGFIMIHHG